MLRLYGKSPRLFIPSFTERHFRFHPLNLCRQFFSDRSGSFAFVWSLWSHPFATRPPCAHPPRSPTTYRESSGIHTACNLLCFLPSLARWGYARQQDRHRWAKLATSLSGLMVLSWSKISPLRRSATKAGVGGIGGVKMQQPSIGLGLLRFWIPRYPAGLLKGRLGSSPFDSSATPVSLRSK